jgi:uncharacterized protein
MSDAASPAFEHLVTTPDEAQELLGDPGDVTNKLIDRLDEHCVAFIARSPFMVVATHDGQGGADASPRGGAPGWVEVLDEHRLVIPDALGNALGDTVHNVLRTNQIGLLFMIPGLGETLRVNGRAVVTKDPEILDRHVTQGKRPKLAIGVEVEVAFLHCAKAFMRSKLWKPETWGGRDGMARPAQIWTDHIALPNVTLADLEELLEDAYTNRLY